MEGGAVIVIVLCVLCLASNLCVCFVSFIITPFVSINFIAHVQEITSFWTNKKAA